MIYFVTELFFFMGPVRITRIKTPPLDPKGSAGALKPQLQLIPPELNHHLAGAIALGAKKYGPWNWRTAKVESMTYVGAIRRHLDAYLDGEEIDPESGVHHLGHVAACCAIVLDARKHGTLVDNRPGARPSLSPPVENCGFGPGVHHSVIMGSNLHCTKPYQFLFGDGKLGASEVTISHAEWEFLSGIVARAKPSHPLKGV